MKKRKKSTSAGAPLPNPYFLQVILWLKALAESISVVGTFVGTPNGPISFFASQAMLAGYEPEEEHR